MRGSNGDDGFSGFGGYYQLTGGKGGDIYITDDTGDKVVEKASGGIDTVQSYISYQLGNNLEHLTLLGQTGIDGTGNSEDNQITGNSGANSLYGQGGNDTLNGGAGDDILTGNAGADVFVFANRSGDDTITDFTRGEDLLDFNAAGLSFDQLSISSSGGDTTIFHKGDTILLAAVDDLDQSDFL